ncbi:unnamed protein product [Paramecium sonneborni]|uniref:Uncharacterized protein n=1 Tax=Paramecium sonneborni TaxID=65129 RepID=A0A8S1P457_9CILI|nr:unnamed protein product [Paramecium sonneborni]
MLKTINALFFVAKYVPAIVKLAQNKFSNEYQQAQKAKQLYVDDPTELSTIFQGNMDLENRKQKFFKIREEAQKEVIEFFQKYKFQKLYNTKVIQDNYFIKEKGYCIIDLKEIAKDEFFIFTKECGITNPVLWLNKALQKIQTILVIYFQGEFQKNQLEDEFLTTFPDIFEFIQQEILNKVAICLKEHYNQVQNIFLKQYQETMEYNQKLEDLIQQLNSQKISLKEFQENLTELFNVLIQNFDEQVLIEIQIKFLSNLDQKKKEKFRISDVLSKKYHKMIINGMKEKILNSLKIYRQEDYKKEKQQIEKIILKQIEQEDFIDGIKKKEINQNLQLIIYSIDWINLGIDRNKIQLLIYKLQDYCSFVDDNQFLGLNQSSFDHKLVNFQKYYTIEIKNALEWYQRNVDESTNLLVICQIYMILANFQFKQSKIFFGDYDSDARNILFHLVRYLNDLRYGYFNHQMVQLCEIITHQIQQQIFEDIEMKIQREDIQNQQTGELFKSRIQIKLSDSNCHVCLQDITISILKGPSKISKEYYKKNQLFELILDQKIKNFEKYQKKQLELIQNQYQQRVELIKEKQKKGEYNFIQELIFPDQIFFESLSQNQTNSNVITLVISGFCSQGVNKLDQWKHVLNKFSGTVVALNWDTKKFFDFISMVKSWVVQNLSTDQILEKSLIENPFEQAYEQAQIVGKCLAHLLDGGYLFGDRQINIMCHSLGSQILLECVHELDRFSEKKLINDIIIFGGVADIHQLQKRRWNSISGSINNFYSENDKVLRYCYKFSKFFEYPCGLNPIKLGYKKIQNYDVSKDVEGHLNYWDKLDKIINISDFNSDFKTLVRNIVEKY